MLEAGKADRLERGTDTAHHLLALHPDLLHRERDLVRHVGGKKLRLEILKDHPDSRRDFAYARAVERAAADSHHPVNAPPSNSGTIRLRHFASVDLPAPDAPITPTISPAAAVKLMRLSAGRSPSV